MKRSDTESDTHRRAVGLFGRIRGIKGSGLKSRLLNPRNEFWDRRLGVHTFGFTPAVGAGHDPDWRSHYVPTTYASIFRVLRHLKVNRDDVLVDFGCGLGRAVFVASWMGVKRAIGVEIDERLVAAARHNQRGSRVRDRDIEIVQAAAEQWEPRDVTVVFMFNPFGTGTMQSVLDRLEADLKRNPRRIRIAYENPIHSSVLDGATFLRRTGSWDAGKPSTYPYPVMVWESIS
jgi:precorrin-6B methylase 2